MRGLGPHVETSQVVPGGLVAEEISYVVSLRSNGERERMRALFAAGARGMRICHEGAKTAEERRGYAQSPHVGSGVGRVRT